MIKEKRESLSRFKVLVFEVDYLCSIALNMLLQQYEIQTDIASSEQVIM